MKISRTFIALGGASLLALSTSVGIAGAQDDPEPETTGTLSSEILGSAAGSVSDSPLASSEPGINDEETWGFLNTLGSAGIGEATLGSAPGSVQDAYTGSVEGLPDLLQNDPETNPNVDPGVIVEGSLNTAFCGEPTVDHIEECLGVLSAGSLDTGSLVGSVEAIGGEGSLEPVGGSLELAVGSLAPLAVGSADLAAGSLGLVTGSLAPIAGSLAGVPAGSLAAAGSLIPLAGSAAIGAGVHSVATGAIEIPGIELPAFELPPLPEGIQLPGFPQAPQQQQPAPEQQPAPGPGDDGRGRG